MAYTERLRQKAVTFSGFECMKGYGFSYQLKQGNLSFRLYNDLKGLQMDLVAVKKTRKILHLYICRQKNNVRGSRDMSKFARSSKNSEKLEKSQFLLKILNSRVKRGSKNCDFCNFCDFSKNCEKLEKSQFLLKLP